MGGRGLGARIMGAGEGRGPGGCLPFTAPSLGATGNAAHKGAGGTGTHPPPTHRWLPWNQAGPRTRVCLRVPGSGPASRVQGTPLSSQPPSSPWVAPPAMVGQGGGEGHTRCPTGGRGRPPGLFRPAEGPRPSPSMLLWPSGPAPQGGGGRDTSPVHLSVRLHTRLGQRERGGPSDWRRGSRPPTGAAPLHLALEMGRWGCQGVGLGATEL